MHIAVLSALALVVAAPVAEAKGKKKPKRQSVVTRTATLSTASDGQAASAVATCPKKTIALGGGFQAPFAPGFSIVDFTVVHESRRTGARSWGVSGVRQDGGAAGPALTLTASVHCRSPRIGKRKRGKKPRLIAVTDVPSTSAPGGANAALSATAACPPGLRLVGGGFRVAPPPVLTGAESFPTVIQSAPIGAFSWQATAVNGGAVSRSITAHAYCLTRVVPTFTRATGELAGGDGARPQATVTAQACAGKRRLVGGGFSHERNSIFKPQTFESYALNGEWSTGAWNPGAEGGNLSSTGICL
jgi:hypothetical protein